MTIAQAPQAWIKYTLLIGVVAVLAACGGGGGGDKEPPIAPPDTTPNTFTLNVVEGAAPSAEVISEAITVGGINVPAPISITGGEYSINSGAYTSAAGTVTNGQRVTVKVTSSNEVATDVSAVLTIGGITGTFIVTTLADTTPPTAQITFPPPVSMKDAETLLIRGTASDDYSNIASLTVNGVAAVSEDGFANWTAEVELNNGDNQLVVVVSDTAENTDDSAASVMVHRAAATSAFPDNTNTFTEAQGITFDGANGRLLVSSTDEFSQGSVTAIFAVDVNTGVRSILSGPDTLGSNVGLRVPHAMLIDPVQSRNRVIVTDLLASIYEVDLTSGIRTLLSDNLTPSTPTPQPEINDPTDIVLDPTNNDFAYFVDQKARNVQRINLISGVRTLIFDNTDIPESGKPFMEPRSLIVDTANNRVLVGDGAPESAILFSIDLTTKIRTVISDLEHPQSDLPLIGARSMASDNLSEYVLVDTGTRGIVKVDLPNGERTEFFPPLSRNPSHSVHYFHLEQGMPYLWYLDETTKGVYAIDLQSAEFVILSKAGIEE